MKQITFIPSHPLTEESKERLRKSREKDLKRIEKMKEDYDNGVYDELIKTLPKNNK